jgi:hypothetical protein
VTVFILCSWCAHGGAARRDQSDSTLSMVTNGTLRPKKRRASRRLTTHRGGQSSIEVPQIQSKSGAHRASYG